MSIFHNICTLLQCLLWHGFYQWKSENWTVHNILLKLILKNLFFSTFTSIWTSWFFGRSPPPFFFVKIPSRHDFFLNTNTLSSEYAALTNWKRMSRKTNFNISCIFLENLCHHFSVMCQQWKIFYTKHSFISTNAQNQNVYFQSESFSQIF